MGATNHTTNYDLSQFIGTDKPTWLTDYNGDMEKIDTALKGIDTTSTANSTNIQNMQQSISANTTNIAKNTTDITTLQANLGTVAGQYDQIHHEMGALEQKLTTDMSNLQTNVDEQITTLQTNVDGQIATINQRIDDLEKGEIPEIDIIDTVEGIESNTQTNKVTGALASKGILSSVNAVVGQLQGFTPVINQSTGEMTGYKTTIGGADTVFPFTKGLKYETGNATVNSTGITVNTQLTPQYIIAQGKQTPYTVWWIYDKDVTPNNLYITTGSGVTAESGMIVVNEKSFTIQSKSGSGLDSLSTSYIVFEE